VKLYIMRHGPAEDQSSSGRDYDRSLTPSGRERVRGVARLLVNEDEAPLWVVSSPLVRALQTAEIVAASTKLSERGGSVDTRQELEPGVDCVPFVKELLREDRKRVMLVGHEPDCSTLVGLLVGEPLPVSMDKAMVVGLSVKSNGAALRFVLDPKGGSFSIDLRVP
jgi:phosphohistidine phosphatase